MNVFGFDLPNLITGVISVGALLFAWRSNWVASQQNNISENANDIAERNRKIEADKLVLDWGQRVVRCLSEIIALRLLSDADITADEFKSRRRQLRSEVFALKEEGGLFFLKLGEEETTSPVLLPLVEITSLTNGTCFLPPKKDDWETRRKDCIKSIRTETRFLIAAIQSRVGNEWALG